jgi:hypothetical protein
MFLCLFLVLVVASNPLAQSIDKLEYVKLLQSMHPSLDNFYTTNDSIYNEFEKVTLLAIFKGDERIDTLIGYINYVDDIAGDPPPYYNEHFNYLRHSYKLAKRFRNVPDRLLMDSVLAYEPGLLYSFQERIDSAYFVKHFYSSISNKSKDVLASYYYKLGWENPNYNKILNDVRDNYELYSKLMWLGNFKWFMANDILHKEALFYEKNYHLLQDSNYNHIYKHVILKIPHPNENFSRLFMKTDSAHRRDEFITDSLKLVHYNYVLSGKTKFIWPDTTLLHHDGRVRAISPIDDGFRFDLLSNKELVTRFLNFNFEQLLNLNFLYHHPVSPYIELVNLEKITQILGDRFLSGQLTLNEPNLKTALDRLDHFVVNSNGLRDHDYLRFVMRNCYLRLWKLAWPYILHRLESNTAIEDFDIRVGNYFIDEELLRSISEKALYYISRDETDEIHSYLKLLAEIDRDPFINMWWLPPRRYPVRDNTSIKVWKQKYIEPVWSVLRKKN